MPHRVDGVGDDGRPALLSVVAEDGEDISLPWVDGHFQIRVGVKEHALF